MNLSATVLGLLLVAAACRDGESTRPSGGTNDDGAATRAAKWSASEPPPARSCKADPDCGVFASAPGDDPCCDVTVTAAPLSVHYMRANAEWRLQNCSGVSCPPQELPGARPASCAFTPRCADGTCANSCDQE